MSAGHRAFPQPVYRTTPLPVGSLRGTYLITSQVLRSTREALTSFAQAGHEDGGHEGLVFWAGREFNGTTVLLHVVIPRAHHSPLRVMVDAVEVGRMQRALRPRRLALLTQVHSHPGQDTRHSDGDDALILMPFEGMLSLVAPNYGAEWDRIEQLGVHQFQEGRWVWCTTESVRAHCLVIPDVEDMR